MTSRNSWASTALWRRYFADKNSEEESNEVEEPLDNNNGTTSTDEPLNDDGESLAVQYPIRNEENTEIRKEFVREMRIRDMQGRSLRTTTATTTQGRWTSCGSQTPPTTSDLRVPSSPGSTDYIYLAQ